MIYVDSGVFIAYLRKKDQDHARVRTRFVQLQEDDARLVTCDAVIGEVATRFRYDIGLQAALTFHRMLQAFGTRLRVYESTAERRRQAFELMAQYADLRLSYADAIGALVAQDTNASSVFALDNDFRLLGFDVIP